MPAGFDVTRFPRSRRIVVDAGAAARRRHTMLALAAVDVTEARRRLRSAPDPRPTFTAFVVAATAAAAAEHPAVHAYRDLWGRLWTPRTVDVNVSVEIELEDRSFPMNHVLRDAGSRTPAELAAEMRRVRRDPASSPTMGMAPAAAGFLLLPGFLRSRLLWLLHRLPRHQQRLAGTIGVTSVGMFGSGTAWGVATPVHTLDVIVGGIDTRPRYAGDEIVPGEFVHLTLMFDHDVVDGAPAARFTQRLRDLLESAAPLPAPDRG